MSDVQSMDSNDYIALANKTSRHGMSSSSSSAGEEDYRSTTSVGLTHCEEHSGDPFDVDENDGAAFAPKRIKKEKDMQTFCVNQLMKLMVGHVDIKININEIFEHVSRFALQYAVSTMSKEEKAQLMKERGELFCHIIDDAEDLKVPLCVMWVYCLLVDEPDNHFRAKIGQFVTRMSGQKVSADEPAVAYLAILIDIVGKDTANFTSYLDHLLFDPYQPLPVALRAAYNDSTLDIEMDTKIVEKICTIATRPLSMTVVNDVLLRRFNFSTSNPDPMDFENLRDLLGNVCLNPEAAKTAKLKNSATAFLRYMVSDTLLTAGDTEEFLDNPATLAIIKVSLVNRPKLDFLLLFFFFSAHVSVCRQSELMTQSNQSCCKLVT